MVYSDEGCGGASPQLLSFSLSIRSSRRRSRLARPPTPPPTCEESVHYPVFNREDPRHNPTLRQSVYLDETDNPPTAAHSTGSMRWMHGLPGRSIRRARSGLQALRSGLHRRSLQNADGDHVINGLWASSDSAEGSSDPNERVFSSTVSEASTEEDYDFGTDLYRTGCNYPGKKSKTGKALSVPPPIPASSMETDRHPLSPIEGTPEATPNVPSDQGLLITCTDSNDVVLDDLSPVTLDDDWTIISAEAAKCCSVDEAQHPSMPETLSDPDIPDLAAAGEIEIDSNFDDAQASVALEADADCVSHRSSCASHESGIAQMLCVGADVLDMVEATPSERSSVESSHSSDDEEIIELIPAAEIALAIASPEPEVESTTQTPPAIDDQHLADTAPTISIANPGGLDYFLSLDILAGNDSQDSKTSSEEPSPNSLDNDDRDAPLSPWFPTDKAERSSLLSLSHEYLRDEFFLVDGKSTDLRPDRGDNPIKGERGFAGDGGLHSGPGLDRNLSVRTQEIPEIIGPGGPLGMPSPLPYRRDREGSDSTEEYLVTYSLFQRHYFS
ncbi:hypothetical protein BJX70DRAFT_351957 [Aspergillus crustosus]